jgi:myosin heavy subunit
MTDPKRGFMPENNENVSGKNDVVEELPLDDNGFIAGTTYKSPTELVKGYTNLMEKFSAQGNELGSIKKDHDSLKSQAETLAALVKEKMVGGTSEKPATEQAVDFDAELSNIEGQMRELDPLSLTYSKSVSELMNKITKLSTQKTRNEVMSEASKLIKQELTNRDIKASHEAFHSENPLFNTPEMQTRIKEYIAKDKTGMSDPLSAFREIERDDARIEAKKLADENAEMKRLIDLNKGKEETGKVVVKNGSPGAPTQPAKAQGKDLEAGMLNAIKAAGK